MNKQAFNERLKIRANFYNAMAVAFLTTGVVAPLVSIVYGWTAVVLNPALVFSGWAICLLACLTLHLQALTVIEGIKE